MGDLWIQERVLKRELTIVKVPGADNPADLMTKYLAAEVIERHCQALQLEFPTGRASKAPTLSQVHRGRALWEVDQAEESADSDEPGGLARQMQSMDNGLWTKKWKILVKNHFESVYNGQA